MWVTDEEITLMMILNAFWHVHPYWLDPQRYISLLHNFQSQNCQVRYHGTLPFPFHIWITSWFCYSVQLLDPQDSRMEHYHPPLAFTHTGCLQMSAICLSHWHSKQWGCSPNIPEAGRKAALTNKLQAESKFMEGLSPQALSSKEYSLENLFGAKIHQMFQVAVPNETWRYGTVWESYTTAAEAQSLHTTKPRKATVLEARKGLPLMLSSVVLIKGGKSPVMGCCEKWHACPASRAAGTRNGSSLNLRSPQRSGNTREKVLLTLTRKTFQKISHMTAFIFNLCVHLLCWVIKDWEGKVSSQVHQHLSLPRLCLCKWCLAK